MNTRRMLRDCALVPAVAFALLIVVECLAAALPAAVRSDAETSIEAVPGAEIWGAGVPSACDVGFRSFLKDLDRLLLVHPQRLDGLLWLLEQSFPLKGCAIAEVFAVSKRSRYFADVNDDVLDHVISFDTSKFVAPRDGYYVSFAVDKMTGDIRHRSVSRH
jgi:hypothetical protein